MDHTQATRPQPVNLAPANTDDDDFIDLIGVWRTVWRRKWAISLLVLVVSMATTLVTLSMTPIYQGTATLLIDPRQSRVVSIEQIYNLEGSGNDFLQTQVELLRSRALAERVVRELNLVTHPEFDPEQRPDPLLRLPDLGGLIGSLRDLSGWIPVTLPADLAGVADEELDEAALRRDAVTRALMSRVSVEPIRRTQMVSVAVEMADPRSAARIANSLAQGYIEGQLEARMQMSVTATSWMNSRLEELRESLRQAEDALQMFREMENLVDVQGIATVATSELSMTGTRLNDAQRNRAEAENLFRQVQGARSGGLEALLTLPAVLANPLVQQFMTAEARARARVEELSQRYGPRHPTMEAARTELETARDSLRAQVEQIVASIERNYQLALANERALTASFEATKSEIQDISRKEFRLRELQREVDTNRALYDTFLERLKETSATADLETANARIVDRAVTPVSPIKPRKSMIVAIAALLALFIGVALALLLEKLNNTFKRTEDVENSLNLSVLGILPLTKEKDRSKVMRLYHSEKHKSFAESVRTLRTSVLLALAERKHACIMVTSSVPAEGKTTTATNLAHSLAQLGKVLLVDGDMRRPSIGKAFGMPTGTPGLANLIAGNAEIDDCLHATEGFDLLTAGTVPPDPLQLLASPRYASLMRELAAQYDYVVLDSPPTQAVSDAVVLSAVADAVIYVVKSESTAVPLAAKGVGQLLQNNAPVTGVLLNQVNVSRAQRYGYRYGGYYDYYGYSSKT